MEESRDAGEPERELTGDIADALAKLKHDVLNMWCLMEGTALEPMARDVCIELQAGMSRIERSIADAKEAVKD